MGHTERVVRVGDERSGAPISRDSAWSSRYQELVSVVAKLGRLPRCSDDCDAALLTWIANQRRAPFLADERQRMLEDLQGWKWDPRDVQWQQRAEELRGFVTTEKRSPRVRNAHAEERALAHWVSRQRVARDEGRLSEERVAMLDYAMRNVAS